LTSIDSIAAFHVADKLVGNCQAVAVSVRAGEFLDDIAKQLPHNFK
jgi:hypothetical protein